MYQKNVVKKNMKHIIDKRKKQKTNLCSCQRFQYNHVQSSLHHGK